MIRHVSVWQTRERLDAGQQSVGEEHDRTLHGQQRNAQTTAAVIIGAADAGRLVAVVVVRRRPNLFSLAGRQILQAQVRHRARAHYHPDADEKRTA